MAEKINFHFEGKLSDSHRMNFYEAARFQYAAARLLVKLAQFRETGKFKKKITHKSNFDIRLTALSDGSFNINVEELGHRTEKPPFVNVPLSDLLAYTSERVLNKMEEEEVKKANAEIGAQTVSMPSPGNVGLASDSGDPFVAEVSLASTLYTNARRRRLSELHREERLNESSANIAKIDFARGEKLIAMSAPLIGEMATALRTSADTLEVSSLKDGRIRSIMFLDQKMAQEIETSVVDDDITAILGDITQFNKDNGWGKVRIENEAKLVSFTIPYDLLPDLRQRLISSMSVDSVYLQSYFVRDKAKEVIRLIVVGILPTPKA